MGKNSLSKKLSLYIILAVLFCLILGQTVQYTAAMHHSIEQCQEASSSNADQLTSYLDIKLKNVVERLFYVQVGESFRTSLEAFLMGDTSAFYPSLDSQISSALSMHRVTEPLISSMFLYTHGGNFSDTATIVTGGFRFEQTPYYTAYLNSSAPVIWLPRCVDPIFITHRDVVPVLHPFEITGVYSNPVLLANISLFDLQLYLNDFFMPEDASFILFDQQGSILSQSVRPEHTQFADQFASPENLCQLMQDGSPFVSRDIDHEEYWINYRSVHTSPWGIIYFQAARSAYDRSSHMLVLFVMLNIILGVFALIFVTQISRYLTKPLRGLAEAMSKAEEKQYDIDFPYTSNDEVGILAEKFRHLMQYSRHLFHQMNLYVEQLKKEKEQARVNQLLKSKAELKALQAQINPHFLYNTLDSIRWKAEEIDADEISKMTQALANVFRIGLSRGREIISVEDELRHVKSYLEIQCIRYGEKITFQMDVPEELNKYYIVKLILQPLVENAIYHGIKDGPGTGNIRITGRREGDCLIFRVEDNGIGIEPDTLKVLNDGLKHKLSVRQGGYGIFNVNERLTLYFGNEYGMRLESKYHSGTAAILTMPTIEENEVDKYVPDTGSR